MFVMENRGICQSLFGREGRQRSRQLPQKESAEHIADDVLKRYSVDRSTTSPQGRRVTKAFSNKQISNCWILCYQQYKKTLIALSTVSMTVQKGERKFWKHEGRPAERPKSAKGRWNPEKQLWYVCYGKVVGTALEKHIDVDGFDK